MNDLVSTDWLSEHLTDFDLVVVDIRWVSGSPDGGYQAYLAGHIPGAIFLSLDETLSDRSDMSRGRHPLPEPRVFAAALASVGIGQGSRLVVYDDSAGSIAARLWWMMNWIGADSTAVLDGGISKWISEKRPLEAGNARSRRHHTQPLAVNLNSGMVAGMKEVESLSENSMLIDARAPERYRGEVEPIDSRGGHIPGAVNHHFAMNLTDSEAPVFLSSAQLRKNFRDAGADEGKDIICYCGSGVTACHNLLALKLAGFQGAKLYPGSWSEWICYHKA
jgi:thiosulfate/3-mercaptopyruvate sulfurtransferase